MITLGVTKSLEIETTAAVLTDFYATWDDVSPTTFVPSSSNGSVSTIGTTTLVAALAWYQATTQRQVTFLSILSRADGQTVRVKIDVSGTDLYLTGPVALDAGESLVYTDATGWVAYDVDGAARTSGIAVVPAAAADEQTAFDLEDTATGELYVGTAARGAATSDPVWTIKRTLLNLSGSPSETKRTDPTATWDDRVTETYS